MDNPKFKTVVDFVRAQEVDTKFSFDGTRGTARSRLCMHPSPRSQPGKQMDCVDIALEGKFERD